MSGAFIEVFGKLTLAELVIYGMAIGFLFIVGHKAYIKAKNYFYKKRDKEIDEKEEHDSNIDDHQELFKLFTQLKEQNELIIEGLSSVLKHMFVSLCEDTVEKKEITSNIVDSIESLYRPYHKFNLNGKGDKLYKDCMKLPIRNN